MTCAHIFYVLTIVILFSTLSNIVPCQAQLSSTFYDKTCPNGLQTIRKAVTTAISREPRMAASLIRLHFHDCFVQGCDASLLLDDSATIRSERNAIANMNSTRGFDVIETVKSEVERVCPGVVSCADILAVAARDASVAVGGPNWTVKLGRRDSTNANLSEAQIDLPDFAANLSSLISLFYSKGLTVREMVALSGAHTLGQARCFTFRDRIYSNGSNIDAGFSSIRRRQCPLDRGNATLAPLDLVTPNSFDNNYFKNLIQKKGLLASDQVLFSGDPSRETDRIVVEYSKSPNTFYSDFAYAMIKMGDIKPPTGSQGIVRRVCNVLN